MKFERDMVLALRMYAQRIQDGEENPRYLDELLLDAATTIEWLTDEFEDNGGYWRDAKLDPPPVGKRIYACGGRGGVFIAKTDEPGNRGKKDGGTEYRSFAYWKELPKAAKEVRIYD